MQQINVVATSTFKLTIVKVFQNFIVFPLYLAMLIGDIKETV